VAIAFVSNNSAVCNAHAHTHGQADMTSAAGYRERWFTRTKAVTHITTNWAQCTVT